MVDMRIGIIGAGAVGTFFGARLAQAGHDVTVLARGAALDAVRADGLRVDIDGQEPQFVPVHAAA